jgi:hypothetical protein
MSLSNFLVSGCMAGVLAQTPAAPLFPSDSYQRYVEAGCPRHIACWAIPSDTGKYTVYRIGGGCPFPCQAQPPLPHEGTWGWDYIGRWLPHNVILGWWHDRLYQGGSGAYRTDGPTLNHGEGTLRDLHDQH